LILDCPFFRPDIFQVGTDRASVKMLPPDAAGSQWVLVLLSLLLSAADEPQRAPIGLASDSSRRGAWLPEGSGHADRLYACCDHLSSAMMGYGDGE
jgi:hypothetical protein